MRWTIGWKLGLGFGSVLALTAGFGLYSREVAADKADALRQVSQLGDRSRDIAHLSHAAMMIRTAIRNFLLEPSAATKAEFDKACAEADEQAEMARSNFVNPERRALCEAFQQALDEYQKFADEVAEQTLSRLELVAGTLNPAGDDSSGRLLSALETVGEQAAGAIEAEHAASAILIGRLDANRFLAKPSDEGLTRARASIAAAKKALEHAAHIRTPVLASAAAEASEAFETYASVFERVAALRASSDSIMDQRMIPRGKDMERIAGELVASLEKDSKETAEQALASAEAAQTTGLIVLGVTLAMGAGLSFVMSRSMSRRLSVLAARAQTIADRDLTGEPLPVRGSDEIASLTGAINAMGESLRSVMSELASSAREVASASTEIAASSEEISAGLAKQEAQVSQIGSAATEMSAAAADIAQRAEAANADAQAAGKAAGTGESTVSAAVAGMKRIAESVDMTGSSVKELGRQGEQIGRIIAVISDIADQTNLLALNAAIEAARAGEHGRGFAVVADEVRKLAERTVRATDEVASSIKSIQSETATAVQRMEAGVKEVDEGVARVNEAGGSLREIVTKTQAVGAAIGSIAAAAGQQSAATEEVTRSVEEISSMAKQAAAGATQSAAAASQLSAKAESLQSVVARFKLPSSRSA